MDRRKNAEELLKWKTMLDKEEQRVFKLEKQALKVWEHKDKDSKKEKEPSQSVAREETDKPSSKKDNGTTKGISDKFCFSDYKSREGLMLLFKYMYIIGIFWS